MQCGGCGQANPERAKFCSECGRALTAPGPVISTESRRTVTVVFADMVGFTSLGERLDQESLRRVMDRFYAEMRGAIEAQDGTLAKFIGDAVLAVWGTPQVREDDALRAVRAADAMRRALAGLNEDLETRWGVRVGMRTGVNTGEVVVDPARPADLLVGDTLNVAARLEQAAADGEVLVGPDTFRLVRDDAVLEPVAPLSLKGKARPMPAWRVVDTVRRERRTDERLQAPLVGREPELAELRGALADVVAARACQMVTVIGSPGLGKTRLVAEFTRAVAGDATVLHGRCQATGEGITFQPVAEVMRAAAHIEDDDDPAAAMAKLAALLPAGEPDAERVTERVAGLLGLAPVASAEETFWAVRRVLEAMARERPVVLVHDDIHWGQPTFLDLLEYFTEWIRDAPVLVVALARPELREVRPRLAEAALSLAPLDDEASRAMVGALLGEIDLPGGLAQRVLETTEGNPLFLGETLRMLADQGVLRREGDTWIAGDVGDFTMPPTINALLSARIQALEPDERSVVERAAVIGHAFYRGAVAELAPEPVRPQVDGALETLGRKEMVRPEDEWWLDEQVFRFHHVLIRDAAYGSLLKEARAELHERFAVWLEAKAGELAGEHEEVIAFHLEQAHAYRLELGSLDEAGRDLATRAGRRLHSAGCRALAREDLPAAANLLRRALAPLGDDLPARQEVLVDLCEALLSAGDTAAAEPVVEALGLGAAELRDDRLQARALVFALQLDNLTGAGHLRDAADDAATAAATLAAAGDRAGEAKAHQVVAQAEALLGQVAAAEAALDRALVAARAADDRRRITAVLSGAPRAALWGPAPIVRASGRCLDVVRILRMTPGNRHVEAAALRSQAVLEAMRGRADAARGILETCRMTLEELGLTLELRETAVHAGIVELLAGEPEAAEVHLRTALDGFRTLGIEGGAAQAAGLLAQALLAQGRDEEALAAAAFADEHGGEDLKTAIAWRGVRAQVLAHRGEHDGARVLAREAVALGEPTDALADKAGALMALAAVEQAAGNETAAREAAAQAGDLYAAKDHTVGVAQAEAVGGAAGPGPAGEPSPPDEPRDGGAQQPADASPSAGRRRKYLDAAAARDFEAIKELYAEDWKLIDTRQIGWGEWDRDAFLANSRSLIALDSGDVRNVPRPDIETLLDEGCLRAEVITFRATTAEGGRLDNAIGVVEVGAERARYCEIWDADDREGMLARAGELRPLAAAASDGCVPAVAYARMTRYYDTRDWDALRALVAEDLVMTDNRPVGWDPVRGADGLIELFAGGVELAPDLVYRIDRVLAHDAGTIAITSTHIAHAADSGAEVAVPVGTVARVGEDGLLAVVEVFDHDDEAGMLARFAELAVSPGDDPMTDMATRGWRDAFDARDWERLARYYVPDVVMIDHRAGLRHELRGRDALVDAFKQSVQEDVSLLRWAPLAEGSDRVAVFRWVLGSAGENGWEIDQDQVTVLDADLRVVRVDVFDEHGPLMDCCRERLADPLPPLVHRLAEEDEEPVAAAGEHVGVVRDGEQGVLVVEVDGDGRRTRAERVDEEADALALMDAWAAERPLALAPWVGDNPQARLLESWIRALNSRDLDALAALQSPDFRIADHRPGLRNVIDGNEESLAVWRWLFDEVPDVGLHGLVLQQSGDVVHGRLRYTSRLKDYVIDVETVSVVRDGLATRTDTFDLRDPAAAALFERLSREEPLSMRLARRWERIFNARDWAAAEDHLAPGYEVEDRRPLGGAPVFGAAASIEMARGIAALGEVTWRYEPLEVAEDVALLEAGVGGLSDDLGEASLTTLQVLIADSDGRAGRVLVFDESQREEALAEARAWTAHVRQARFVEELLGARDFERLGREAFAPGFRQVDRRLVGAPEAAGGAAVAEGLRGALEAIPDWSGAVEIVAVAGDRRVARVVYRGHSEDLGGGEAEIELWILSRIEGLAITESEIHESREAAVAALRHGVDWRAIHEANIQGLVSAVNGRDLGGLVGGLITEDFTQSDRRPIALGPQLDAAAFSEMLAALPDLGSRYSFALELVTFRGPWRVARMYTSGATVEGGGGWEVEIYTVTLLRDGRMASSDLYASREDAEAALHRAADSDQVRHERQAAAFERALVSYDHDAVRAQLTDDFVQEDRRALGAQALDADGFVNMLRASEDLWPEFSASLTVVAVTGDRRVTRMVYRTGQADALSELTMWTQTTLRGERMCRSVLFDSEEEALAALAEPGTVSPALQGYAALVRGFNEEDWNLLGSVMREDYRWIDRRPGLRMETHSRDEFVALLRGIRQGSDLRWEQELLREVADGSVSMTRVYQRGTFRGGPYEIAFLSVSTTGADGRFVASEIWEDGDSAAEQRLEELAVQDEPPVLTYLRSAEAAFNGRDWERLRALTAPDMLNVDHRPFGSGAQGADSGQLHALVDAIPDATWSHDVIEVFAPDRALVRLKVRGAGADGGPVEIDLTRIVGIDADGRYVRGDVFDDEAAARDWLAAQ
ncbi:MAG: nuclear transport factor 2 family protein [Solirubrobacteraceae bacterium]